MALFLPGLPLSIRAQPAASNCNPPSGIVAWWPGEGNANDIIGGHNGTLLNGSTFTAGEVGQAFSFDGVQGGVVVPDSPSLNFGPGADFSIEAWIRADANIQKFVLAIVDKREAPAIVNGQPFQGSVGYVLFLSNGRLAFQLSQAPLISLGEADYISPQPDLRDSKLHHVALSLRRGAVDGGKLYVDGQLVLTVDPTREQGDLSNSQPLRIGNHATPGYNGFFAGLVDEVSLYNRALTAQEIQAIYADGHAGKCLSPAYDSIPDAWRLKYFGTNFVNDPRAAANADPDADGADNYQEFLAGTDPLNSNSVPVLPAIVSTYAGASGGFRDGFRTAAQFDGSITDLKFEAQGRIWLLESSVSGDLQRPDAGGQRIRIMDTNGVVSTLTGGTNGMVDGPLSQARFSIPNGLAFDSAGNAFIADQGNNRIRKIGTNGVVSTFAGSTAGYRDGFGINAQFNAPSGLAMDANDNLYVADWLNQKIRIITPQGAVSTFAGSYGAPVDIALGRDGTLFIADSQNGQIHRIDTNGVVSVFASGLPVPEHLSLDSQGNVYVSTANQTLEKFGADGTLKWSVGAGAGYRDGLATTAQFVQLVRALALPDGSLLAGDYYHIRQITIGIPPLLLMAPGGGPFTNSLAVSITSAVGGVIRYTLDDSAPTTNSPVYTNSIMLTNTTSTTTTLQAVVFISSNAVSEVVSATFTNAFNVWREQLFGPNYATDPSAAAAADPDGDGSSNYQEFLDGTNPQDANSVRIRVAARLVPAITWNSVSNKVYRVMRTDDIYSTNSIVVAPAIVATNTVTTFIDLNPNLRAFYWIDIVPAGPGP
ncbi:MAG: LamG-like jellyroll fold domain-containing protein [Limisphaerales bacterium]